MEPTYSRCNFIFFVAIVVEETPVISFLWFSLFFLIENTFLKESFGKHKKLFNTWKFLFKITSFGILFPVYELFLWFSSLFLEVLQIIKFLCFSCLEWMEPTYSRCNFIFFVAIVVEETPVISFLWFSLFFLIENTFLKESFGKH